MKMRKLLAPVLGLSLMMPAAGAFAAEGTSADFNPELQNHTLQFNLSSKMYTANGMSMMLPMKPVTYMGTTYLPLRYLAANASMKTWYDPMTETTWLDTGLARYEFWTKGANAKVYKVDNMRKALNDPIISMNGHTLVPVRWFADNFDWNLTYSNGMITMTKVY